MRTGTHPSFVLTLFPALPSTAQFLLPTFSLAWSNLFLPPSDVCVRSFLYLFYTLIKLYYRKPLSDQAPSLAPYWISLLRRPRIPVSFTAQQQPFSKECRTNRLSPTRIQETSKRERRLQSTCPTNLPESFSLESILTAWCMCHQEGPWVRVIGQRQLRN